MDTPNAAMRWPHRHLWLIGYRGSGKTTVGQRIASRARVPFADADAELVQVARRSIAEIFRDEGEPAFRDYEEQVITELSRRSPMVIASGGGAILRSANRDAIRRSGFVVWLSVPVDELKRRLKPMSQSQLRPALTSAGAIDEIAEVLALRTPFYRETSHAMIDASEGPDRVAERVLSLWRGSDQGAMGAKRPASKDALS